MESENDFSLPSALHQPISTRIKHSLSSRMNSLIAAVPSRRVSGSIMSALARLQARRLAPWQIERNAHPLIRFGQKLLNLLVYTIFFLIPSAVLSVYQNCLRLVGKTANEAFPEGTWQFYVEYALREDTGRHALETHGFDTILNANQIQLSQADRMAAWVMAAVYTLHTYDALLSNEWRERVYTDTLRQLTAALPNASYFATLYRQWELQRPFSRGDDAQYFENYPAYRQKKFDLFLVQAMQGLPVDISIAWAEQTKQAKEKALPAYQDQMSILAYLEASDYSEHRVPIPLGESQIGIIYQGRYYLLPSCQQGSLEPPGVDSVRAQIAAILENPAEVPAAQLAGIATLRRTAWPALKTQLNEQLVNELEMLHKAPILLNFDQRPRWLPLGKLRQTERGIGDHAMTVFDTGETFVFDLSHIFFDGTWGAAIAEMMTGEALAWGAYLANLAAPAVGERPFHLALHLDVRDWAYIEQKRRILKEASAETAAVNLGNILELREAFKARPEQVQLTVNDLLVLYRTIHAATYQPDPNLISILENLSERTQTRSGALAALAELDRSRRNNPAILMPIDASKRNPRERLHPVSFEVPLESMDLLTLHRQSLRALQRYQHGSINYEAFHAWRYRYLSQLALLGELFSLLKEFAAMGDSTSVSTLKLLAFLPRSLQRILNKIPDNFEVLNDILRGREVFSNVGAVVPGSTLTRFMTAKDDNEQKTLAWSVISSADGILSMTLRDFRPHVALLISTGHADLADRIAQDYLISYAFGLNEFIYELLRISVASRSEPVQEDMVDV